MSFAAGQGLGRVGPPRRRRRGRWTAARLFVASFAGLIAVGTLGLRFLPGLYVDRGLGWIDSFFTATSAVCVTGLVVVDTGTWFTPLGQAWILLLIQAGGLGILTFTTLILSVLGGRHLEMEEAAGGHAAILRTADFRTLLFTVVAVTLSLEVVGALALWLEWMGSLGALPALGHAVFHAVSAFCNAGFSTFPDSLVGVRASTPSLLTVSLLVILGGLGFVVVEDLRARWVRRRTRRVTLHTRLVLWVTGVLLAFAFGAYLVLEWNGVLGGLAPGHRVLNAFFMAVTPRTAGFNTVDYDGLSNAGVILTVVLMTIGGSPGSTAGGIKTIALALTALVLVSRIRGRPSVTIFDRTVPRETVARAVGVVVGGAAVLGTSVLILMWLEAAFGQELGTRANLVRLLFETHSAFGTVGLSMGITHELSAPGRLFVCLLMFLGRVGPAAVVASMVSASTAHPPRFRYAHEDVLLG